MVDFVLPPAFAERWAGASLSLYSVDAGDDGVGIFPAPDVRGAAALAVTLFSAFVPETTLELANTLANGTLFRAYPRGCVIAVRRVAGPA